MKKLYLLLIALPIYIQLQAQQTGDTIVTKVLNYQSNTRDTIAHFPNNNLSYERVVMRYAMRCKDGLVSPPIAGQTNRGCGEWDYSCNTYITDSTKADSIRASFARYTIYPDTNSSGLYSKIPTWQATPQLQKFVNLVSITSEDTAIIGNGNILDSSIVSNGTNGGKIIFILDSSEMATAGLLAGDIDGLNIENQGPNSNLKGLKVRIKATSKENFNLFDSTDFAGSQEVYFHDYNFLNGDNRIQFHSPFNWDGISNIMIELSYKSGPSNQALQLDFQATTEGQLISSNNDIAFNFFPNNYVEADNYYGISGTNERTVEAWIKTDVPGKEIVSWGTNRGGEKFSFRLDGGGQLRLEVNDGFIIGQTRIDDGKWHHVALTFKGSNMYNVRLYVDGVWDRFSSIDSRTINTGSALAVQISKGFHNRYWEGKIDDIRIWSKALSASTLKDWRYKKLDSTHVNYNDLELHYTLNSESDVISDESINGYNAKFKQTASFRSLVSEEHFKNFTIHKKKPNISLYQGTYVQTTSNDTIIDTVYSSPFNVLERTLHSRAGTLKSDSISSQNQLLWPQNNQSYDFQGNLISSSSSIDTIRLRDSTIAYFQRNASNIEIMSFVTPYGINLDLGIDGEAWYFDVTDFLPLLKGDRRLFLSRGGQWQEEMDIQFYFIVGTPPRNVLDISQIWRVDQRSFGQINSEAYYENVSYPIDTSASAYKIRSVVTGHGQQGEFIPRTHYININGGPKEFNWQAWKECAENPVYPQGGTWIYDRAGWCPGMPTDVQEFDITNLIGSANTVDIDYGINTATGDSRYIVSNQLVSYGPINHALDARLKSIIKPNADIEYGRYNPICDGAEIVLQNTGSTQITSAVIEYWVNGSAKDSFSWNDTLDFLEEAKIQLPTSSQLWTAARNNQNTFHAKIISVNGQSDNYANNDSIQSTFNLTDLIPNNFYIQFRTNSAASESRYDVRNDTGGVVFRRNNMSNNTTYRDTLNLGTGCYTFNVYDSDDDGLSFFANFDGSGSVQIKEVGGPFNQTFNPDFGDGIQYNFSVGSAVGLSEQTEKPNISIYPNPANHTLTFETTGLNNANWEIRNAQGKLISSGILNAQYHSKQFIPLGGYSNGIYILSVRNKEQNFSRRFSVIH